MLPFVSKLLLSRQLSFERGELSIFGQRIIIVPIELIEILIIESVKDPNFEKSIYTAMKESVRKFCEELHKKNNIQQKQMLDVLGKLTEMNGYGEYRLIKVNYDKKFAVVHMKGLPSQALRGTKEMKGKDAVDSYWAGMLAGGGCFVFGEDVDAIETRCVITGKNSCEFVLGNKKFLKEYTKK
jgi:predicted hydrocarbon binding protein